MRFPIFAVMVVVAFGWIAFNLSGCAQPKDVEVDTVRAKVLILVDDDGNERLRLFCEPQGGEHAYVTARIMVKDEPTELSPFCSSQGSYLGVSRRCADGGSFVHMLKGDRTGHGAQ